MKRKRKKGRKEGKRVLCSSSEEGQAKAQTEWTVGSGNPSGVGGIGGPWTAGL